MLTSKKSIENNTTYLPNPTVGVYTHPGEVLPEPTKELLVWIQATGVFSSLTYSRSSGHRSTDEITNVIRFTLSDEYRNYFPLLRGLFGMGIRFYVRADVKTAAFIVEISEGQIQSFKAYVSSVIALLQAEISFKKSLKKIIAFEKETLIQQKILYSNYFSSQKSTAAAL